MSRRFSRSGLIFRDPTCDGEARSCGLRLYHACEHFCRLCHDRDDGTFSYATRFIAVEYHKGNQEKASCYFSTPIVAGLALSALLFAVLALVAIDIGSLMDVPENLLPDVIYLMPGLREFLCHDGGNFLSLRGLHKEQAGCIRNYSEHILCRRGCDSDCDVQHNAADGLVLRRRDPGCRNQGVPETSGSIGAYVPEIETGGPLPHSET